MSKPTPAAIEGANPDEFEERVMKPGDRKVVEINPAEYAAIRQAARQGEKRLLNRYEAPVLAQLLRKIDSTDAD